MHPIPFAIVGSAFGFLGAVVLAFSFDPLLLRLRMVAYQAADKNMGDHIKWGYLKTLYLTRLGILFLAANFAMQIGALLPPQFGVWVVVVMVVGTIAFFAFSTWRQSRF